VLSPPPQPTARQRQQWLTWLQDHRLFPPPPPRRTRRPLPSNGTDAPEIDVDEAPFQKYLPLRKLGGWVYAESLVGEGESSMDRDPKADLWRLFRTVKGRGVPFPAGTITLSDGTSAWIARDGTGKEAGLESLAFAPLGQPKLMKPTWPQEYLGCSILSTAGDDAHYAVVVRCGAEKKQDVTRLSWDGKELFSTRKSLYTYSVTARLIWS